MLATRGMRLLSGTMLGWSALDVRPMAAGGDSTSYNAANRDLASLIDEAVTPFTELVDWWQKDDLQRQMRSKIKRQLRASGIAAEAVESLAAEIVDLAKVRTDR